MRTASIGEVRHDFSRLLEWVANGEEVAITKHRKTVARLLPVSFRKVNHPKLPDVTKRLQKVFGKRTIPDKVVKRLWVENRRDY